MKVIIERIDEAFNFEAKGGSGVPVLIDTGTDHGGRNNGARPMELVLMALGSCSAVDIVGILKKQRQDIRDFRIEIQAERRQEKLPAMFTKIKVHYIFNGDLNPGKVKRAIDLSFEKYCSVSEMLGETAKITNSFEINN
jgi:putative redox protein